MMYPCPECMANSIRERDGVCVICKRNYSEEIEASELYKLNRKESTMATKKKAGVRRSKAKTEEPATVKKAEAKTKRKKPVAKKKPLKQAKRKAVPIKKKATKPIPAKDSKATVCGRSVQLILEQNLTDADIIDILKKEFKGKASRVTPGWLTGQRWALNNGSYKRAREAAGLEDNVIVKPVQ